MEVLDTRYGKLISSRKDAYIGRGLFEYGEFSEGEVELFRDILTKDSVVCDVGANIGAHTLAFSRIVRHVYAFEPLPTLFNALCGMIALNDLRNVQAYPVGIGEKEEVKSYLDLDFDRSLNNWGAAPLVDYNGSHGVRVLPLPFACDFLKVDVEGMELEVLKGAAAMIRERKPLLYLEDDRPKKHAELIHYIEQLGYRAYWHTPELFNEKNFYGKRENMFPEVCSLNIACFPKEYTVTNMTRAESETWPFQTARDWREAV
jgi:FkbM family methyltransferase